MYSSKLQGWESHKWVNKCYNLIVSDTSARCNSGFIAHGSSCYLFSHETAAWADAVVTCQLLDSYLVEIDDATENNFIKTVIKSLNIQSIGWLIGGTDKAVEGEFVWMHGKRPLNRTTFTDWAPGEPQNSHSNEGCTCFAKQVAYQWADLNCDLNLNYICESKSSSGMSGPSPVARLLAER